MKKYLETLLKKISDNKLILIKVGSTAVAAALGVIVADLIVKSQEEISLIEEITMSMEEDDLA